MTTPIKISEEIVSISIVTENDNKPTNDKKEIISRPTSLEGVTYKLKSPLTEHAMYITINNIMINNTKYPFEIFINTKSLEHQQWIIALTRFISAIFRYHTTYGNDITFMIRELKSVFDPNGGYIKKNKRIPSLVAEIADIIESHLIDLGTIENKETSEQVEIKQSVIKFEECPSCSNFSIIRQDGCNICTVCGYSKCL